MARPSQTSAAMAAVMALVFLFALASSALMIVINGTLSFGVVGAVICFTVLASGVTVGLLRLVHDWEGDEPHGGH